MKIEMITGKIWSINHKAVTLLEGGQYDLEDSISKRIVDNGYAKEVGAEHVPAKKEEIVVENKAVETVEENKEVEAVETEPEVKEAAPKKRKARRKKG